MVLLIRNITTLLFAGFRCVCLRIKNISCSIQNKYNEFGTEKSNPDVIIWLVEESRIYFSYSLV